MRIGRRHASEHAIGRPVADRYSPWRCRRNRAQFTAEPNNLMQVHSYKYSGLVRYHPRQLQLRSGRLAEPPLSIGSTQLSPLCAAHAVGTGKRQSCRC